MRSPEEIVASLVEVRSHPRDTDWKAFDVYVAVNPVRHMLNHGGAHNVALIERLNLLPVVRAVRDIVLREGLAGSPVGEERLQKARADVDDCVDTGAGLDADSALTLLCVIDCLAARCAALEQLTTDETGYAAGRAVGHVEALAAAEQAMRGFMARNQRYVLDALKTLLGNSKDKEGPRWLASSSA